MNKFMIANDVVNNYKVMSLGPEAFRFWVCLLAIANGNEDRGALPDDERAIAFKCRVSPEEGRRLLGEVEAAGLIDVVDGVRRLHDWGDYQSTASSDAERARKYREKKRASGTTASTSPATAPMTAPASGSAASLGMEPGPRGPAKLGSSDPSPPRTATPSASTPSDDDLPLYEPIGANTAAQVATTRSIAFELHGGTNVPGLVDVWLRTHTADAVQHALRTASGKKRPSRWIEVVLQNHATAPAAPALAVEESHEHRMAHDPAYRARHEAKLRLDEEAIAKKQAERDEIAAWGERMKKIKEDFNKRQEDLYARVNVRIEAERLAKAG